MKVKPLEPQITIRAVAPVVAGLEVLGHDVDAILSAALIRRSLLVEVDGRIPHSAMMRFWEKACELTGDSDLGIHIAEAAPVGSFGLHAYTVLSSPNLREAYRRTCRYQRLIHEATNLEFVERPAKGVLQHALPGGRPVPRQPAEFLVSVWLRFGRQVAGEDWKPDLVCFAHPAPNDRTEHERAFGPATRFASGVTALHIPADILDSPNIQSETGLLEVLDEHARALLERAPARPTLSERVRFRIAGALQDGAPAAEQLATDLNLSLRSLHRGLKADGTSYRELLDQLRHERAVRLLTEPNFSISEVGFLLGFAEISSFYRAFRRWTGTTPADYRSAALLGDPPPSI